MDQKYLLFVLLAFTSCKVFKPAQVQKIQILNPSQIIITDSLIKLLEIELQKLPDGRWLSTSTQTSENPSSSNVEAPTALRVSGKKNKVEIHIDSDNKDKSQNAPDKVKTVDKSKVDSDNKDKSRTDNSVDNSKDSGISAGTVAWVVGILGALGLIFLLLKRFIPKL